MNLNINREEKLSDFTRKCAKCQITITEDMMFYEIPDVCKFASERELVEKEDYLADCCLCEDCFEITSRQIKDENVTSVEDDNTEIKEVSSGSNSENVSKANKRKTENTTDNRDSQKEKNKKSAHRKDASDSDTEWIPPNCLKVLEYITEADKEESVEGVSSKASSQVELIKIPNYKVAANTARYCFAKGCPNPGHKHIPVYLRRVLLEQYNIFIPENARSCPEHVKEYYRDWSFMKKIPFAEEFTSKKITAMLDLLRENASIKNVMKS